MKEIMQPEPRNSNPRSRSSAWDIVLILPITATQTVIGDETDNYVSILKLLHSKMNAVRLFPPLIIVDAILRPNGLTVSSSSDQYSDNIAATNNLTLPLFETIPEGSQAIEHDLREKAKVFFEGSQTLNDWSLFQSQIPVWTTQIQKIWEILSSFFTNRSAASNFLWIDVSPNLPKSGVSTALRLIAKQANRDLKVIAVRWMTEGEISKFPEVLQNINSSSKSPILLVMDADCSFEDSHVEMLRRGLVKSSVKLCILRGCRKRLHGNEDVDRHVERIGQLVRWRLDQVSGVAPSGV